MMRANLTDVSVVVPAYNERRRLPVLLDVLEDGAVSTFEPAGLRVAEMIVVDDGSTDGTWELLEERCGDSALLRPVRLAENRGKGAAVKAGMLAARSPLALLSDADMSTPLEEVGRLARELERGFDIVIGSRGLPESDIVVHQPGYRELAGKSFNLGLRLLTGLPYRDTQCGFKLFRTPAARPLFAQQWIDGFAYDVEILVLARRAGLRVAEVPVRWFNDPDTTVNLFRASGRMALDLLRVAFHARRPVRTRARPAAEQASAADRIT
jgi:dolichyl-phosphate beta-glucosyltransferase